MPDNAKPQLHFDEFVQAARPNVAAKHPLLFLQGYIGKSPSADSIRLYSDPSFNNFQTFLQRI